MKRIVLTGAPSTGKTTIISELIKQKYSCFAEVSRDVILEAQQSRGIDQLYVTHPNEFNEKVLNGRIQQYNDCEKYKESVFIDRGIPDLIAYNNYINKQSSPKLLKTLHEYNYDYIFIFPPWKDIYKIDNERYETYEQALEIHDEIIKIYKYLNYKINLVPKDNIVNRVNYILNKINCF